MAVPAQDFPLRRSVRLSSLRTPDSGRGRPCSPRALVCYDLSKTRCRTEVRAPCSKATRNFTTTAADPRGPRGAPVGPHGLPAGSLPWACPRAHHYLGTFTRRQRVPPAPEAPRPRWSCRHSPAASDGPRGAASLPLAVSGGSRCPLARSPITAIMRPRLCFLFLFLLRTLVAGLRAPPPR